MSRQILKKSYKQFCSAQGNHHISSEYAIIKLQELIDSFRVKSVLEIGIGIGAITGSLLLVNKHLRYSGTEDNSFCLKALKSNLGENYERLGIFAGLSKVRGKFDLIIIDGKDENLAKIQHLVSKRGIIAIEGDRSPQQGSLQVLFPNHKYVHSISLKKNKKYSPFPSENWQGGLKIIFINPSWLQFFWWFKEKNNTRIKYKYPGRYMGAAKK